MMIRMLSARAINRVIFAMLAVALILAVCIPGIWYWKSKAPDRARARFQRLCGRLNRNVAQFQLDLPILPEALEQLKLLRGIDTIDFSGHEVGIEAAKVCAELDQIRGVSLAGTKFDPRGFAELAKMRNLQVVFLSGMSNVEPFVQEMGQFQKLDTLYLAGCNVDQSSVLQISKHPRLAKLTLTNSTLEGSSLSALLESKSLRELWLRQTKLVGNPISTSNLDSVSSLTHLLWFGNKDDFALDGDYLFAADKLPNLQSLELGCKANEVLTCVRRAQAHQNLFSLQLLVDRMPNRSDFSMVKQLAANVGLTIIDEEGNTWDNTRGCQPINPTDSHSTLP